MPDIFVIGGPNGAGKTTAAMKLLPVRLHCAEFANADSIAAGLSPFRPDTVALEAGRTMLRRIRDLAEARRDFAFESTLSARSFAPFLREQIKRGYEVHVIYLWLSSVEIAIQRVRTRVAMGGHSIPEDVIRRRYTRGLSNLFELYMPLSTSWRLYDNSGPNPAAIARMAVDRSLQIQNAAAWDSVREMFV